MSELAKRPGNACLVCGLQDRDKAMVYKGQDWCSDLHRKVITNEVTKEEDPHSHAAMAIGVAIRFAGAGPVVQVSPTAITGRNFHIPASGTAVFGVKHDHESGEVTEVVYDPEDLDNPMHPLRLRRGVGGQGPTAEDFVCLSCKHAVRSHYKDGCSLCGCPLRPSIGTDGSMEHGRGAGGGNG